MQRTHSSAGWFFHLGGLSWSEGATISVDVLSLILCKDRDLIWQRSLSFSFLFLSAASHYVDMAWSSQYDKGCQMHHTTPGWPLYLFQGFCIAFNSWTPLNFNDRQQCQNAWCSRYWALPINCMTVFCNHALVTKGSSGLNYRLYPKASRIMDSPPERGSRIDALSDQITVTAECKTQHIYLYSVIHTVHWIFHLPPNVWQ